MDPQQQNQNENWSSNHRRQTNRRDEQTAVKNGEPTTAVEEQCDRSKKVMRRIS
jgi:hypothetical protein